MPIIANYSYRRESLPKIGSWKYGQNWPAVYIIFNDSSAYVGETLDLVRRTTQHLDDEKFNAFTDICLISDMSYNKSVILDLESFLIKYMSADGSRKLINGNAGVSDHDYFYKKAYEDEFSGIWEALKEKGIVSRSIISIENSELFKYSPFKSLSRDQEDTAYSILAALYKANSASYKSLIEVFGGAGTGKTILAVYIVKLLKDLSEKKDIWQYASDDEVSFSIKELAEKISGIDRIGYVVPMRQLRNTMREIFKSIDGLSEDMVLAPEQVCEHQKFDLLVVDEAHRLYRRKNLPGQQLYAKFDRINEKIYGKENLHYNESDPTELDWIIENSRLQILFYDSLQTIRTADIGAEEFERICGPHLIARYLLTSQMRCKGGNGYYEYVKMILESENLHLNSYMKFDNYQTMVVDNVEELFSIIGKENRKYDLCGVVCGPGWKMNEDIVIQGKKFRWSSGNWNNENNTVLSIHKCQGFDMNYTGVIFGKEIYYDKAHGRVEVNKHELMDNFVKPNGDEAMRQYVLNIYLTLMTRGIHGTYVYAVDDDLRNYLKSFLN
jgi:DUF2075 family protein